MCTCPLRPPRPPRCSVGQPAVPYRLCGTARRKLPSLVSSSLLLKSGEVATVFEPNRAPFACFQVCCSDQCFAVALSVLSAVRIEKPTQSKFQQKESIYSRGFLESPIADHSRAARQPHREEFLLRAAQWKREAHDPARSQM